jgi:hypothetical protein
MGALSCLGCFQQPAFAASRLLFKSQDPQGVNLNDILYLLADERNCPCVRLFEKQLGQRAQLG